MIGRYSLFSLITTAATVSFGQPPSAGHVSLRNTPVDVTGLTTLKEIIAQLDGYKLQALVPDSWEGRVLNAGTAVARVSLRLRFGDLEGIYTLSTKNGDALVARWHGVSTEGSEKAVWLWDIPFGTIFVVEIDPALLQSNEFARYCEDLLLWRESPIMLTSVQLYYQQATRGKEQVVGKGTHEESSTGSLQWWLAATSVEGKAFVGIAMSKPFFQSLYPPESYLVRERFPPLRSRLANFPRQALFEELGKGYSAPAFITYPGSRDRIVIDELLSRGALTEVEVRDVVLGRSDRVDPNVINSRLGALLGALGNRKQLASYLPAMERLCLDPTKGGGFPEIAVGNLFLAMRAYGIDFSHVALTLVERGQFTRLSLNYLGDIAQDQASVRRLSEVEVEPALDTIRQEALERIKARLKNAKPNVR